MQNKRIYASLLDKHWAGKPSQARPLIFNFHQHLQPIAIVISNDPEQE